MRHFWEKNDIKGAIDALRKLPDHSVGIYEKISCVLLYSIIDDGLQVVPRGFSCMLSLDKSQITCGAGASRFNQCFHAKNGDSHLRSVLWPTSCAYRLIR